MYKPAARSNCSFKIVQIARWLPDLIVPFSPLKCKRNPGEKCTFFQFLSTVHAKVANSNPTNYIFLRSAICTLSIEHIKSPFFQILKIGLECLILDFSKTFDKVSHSRLLYKLRHCGIRGNVLHWLESFLHGRTQQVIVNGSKS